MSEAAFVPPSHIDLPTHLGDWEKYYHVDEKDPLVQLALLHAQFEILHPFSDGNGRIGRILVPLFLADKKLLPGPHFYLSAYLEARREIYIQRLRDLGQPGSWDRWVTFFLEGIALQAEDNCTKARQIQDLYERLKKKVIQVTHSQYAVPLLDRIFEKPVLKSSDVIGQPDMPSTPMVNLLLKQFRKSGVLKLIQEGGGRRPQVLALAELINLCEGSEVI